MKYQVILENFISYGEGYERYILTYKSLKNALKRFDSAYNSMNWESITLIKYDDLKNKEVIKCKSIN